MLYDRVTDANGNSTDTYKDPRGRTVRVVYPDGSFAETLYSHGNTPIAQDQEGETIGPSGGDDIVSPSTGEGLPSSFNSYDGLMEEIHIAQRKDSDAPVASLYLYDKAGRLTDGVGRGRLPFLPPTRQ